MTGSLYFFKALLNLMFIFITIIKVQYLRKTTIEAKSGKMMDLFTQKEWGKCKLKKQNLKNYKKYSHQQII